MDIIPTKTIVATLKSNISLIGNILVLLSFVYIFMLCWSNFSEIISLIKTRLSFQVLIQSTSIYIVAISCVACGWVVIINSIIKKSLSFPVALDIYGRSIISKYIPGNFFQYIQRGVLCSANGVEVKNISISVMLEIFLVTFTALMITVLGYNWIVLPSTELIIFKSKAALIVLFALFPAFIFVFKKIDIAQYFRKFGYSLMCAFTLYILFFMLAGFSFLNVLAGFDYDISISSIFFAIYFFSLAFAAGIVIPGAPAGIGVRESVIILVFSPIIGNVESALVATLFRMSTILGDVIFMVIISLYCKYFFKKGKFAYG